MDDAVIINNISVRYGKVLALDNVSARIPASALTVLLGVNGSGKTTLLRLIAGLVKPSKGVVRVLGYDPYREFKKIVRLVFYMHEADTIPKNLRVADVLEEFEKLYGQRVWDLADALGLKDKLWKRVYELSQGYRMRLHILEALASQRKIILLDEPFRGLDYKSRIFVSSIINEFSRKGLTIIVATHVLAKLEPSHVIVLEDGRLVYEGNTLLGVWSGCATLECGNVVHKVCSAEDSMGFRVSEGCRIVSVTC